MDPVASPYENAILSTHAYLAYFRVSTFTCLCTVQTTQRSFIADAAIRIDDVNPAGVYFFTHALTTYRHLHDMYPASFKQKPNEGDSHGLPKHSRL